MTTQLQLRPNQVDHYQRVQDILQKFYFYVDGSEMGTGKTYVATALAKLYNLPCIVVCPLAARKTWTDVLGTYGVGVYNLPETGGVLTYESLRSMKGYQPKHGLLTRVEGSPVQFFPTELLTKIINAGVLIIFDECQKLKNKSAQFAAARAVIRHFYAVSSKSRLALLSATAMDKPDHAVNFLRMVGFITHRNLYTKNGGVGKLLGAAELQEWAMKISREKAEEFMNNNPFKFSQKGAIEYVFKLFIEVLRDQILSIMPRGKTDAIKDVKNGFYYMEKQDELAYTQTITSLSDVLSYDMETGTVVRNQKNMGTITKVMMESQKAKIPIMIRKAKEILSQTVNEKGEQICPKVVLFADYYDVINELLIELKDYYPVELTGRISEKNRNAAITAFQEQSSTCRIIIGNPLVGGLAVGLHDTTGKFPRHMLIMPGFRINELHQATGRVFRDGTVGKAVIRFVYGLSGNRETSIMDALSKKGKVMKAVHKEQSEDGVKFPSEYDDEYEQLPSHIQPTFNDGENLQDVVVSNKTSGDFELFR